MERKTPFGLDHTWHYYRIASVFANVSLGESFNVYFADGITSQGSNFIIVYSQEWNLFYSNELQVIDKTPGIVGVSPTKQQLGVVTYFSQKNVDIIGVTGDYRDTANITMERVSFTTDQDAFFAVIGSKVENEIFKRKIFKRKFLPAVQ